MGIDLERYEELKSEVETAQASVSKAEGALESHMSSLKEDFDCDSLDEAEELLEKFRKEAKTAETDYKEKLAEFEDKWKEYLDE